MKILLSFIFLFTISNSFNSKLEQDSYSKKIFGKWKYIETRNRFGEKIESRKVKYGTMIETGPELIYNSDFTYKLIFTPKNTDSGKWRFNEKTMTIEHQLYIDSTDATGRNLIKIGEAVKQSDGKYYERIDKVISKIDDEEMIVQQYDLLKTYRKEK